MRRRPRALSLAVYRRLGMLINCAAYQDGKKLGDIAPEDISKYVSRPECFVWVAMKDPGPGELASMQHEFDLHELAVEDARHGHQRANIEGLYYVRQKLTQLQHAVLPLLEAVGKLYGGRVPQVCSGLQDYYRDVYDHLVRINQNINSQRDTVTTAIQVNVAMITFGETEVTKRLAAWGALIAVPTFIASVYGMNFVVMPELKWTFGYPMALGLMAAINAYLWIRFRKAGWL